MTWFQRKQNKIKIKYKNINQNVVSHFVIKYNTKISYRIRKYKLDEQTLIHPNEIRVNV
jgi:hypothetical protein